VFKILGKEPKYTKEFVLNYYRKSVQNPEFVGHGWVELKPLSRNTYVRCFEVVYTKQRNAILGQDKF